MSNKYEETVTNSLNSEVENNHHSLKERNSSVLSEKADKLDEISNINDHEKEEGASLHVSNLTRNVKSDHLKEIFGYYGTVNSVDLQIDEIAGLSMGYAYVTFEKSKDAEQAVLYLDGGQIDGNVIKVSFILVSTNKRRRNEIQAPKARRSLSPPRQPTNNNREQSDRSRVTDSRNAVKKNQTSGEGNSSASGSIAPVSSLNKASGGRYPDTRDTRDTNRSSNTQKEQEYGGINRKNMSNNSQSTSGKYGPASQPEEAFHRSQGPNRGRGPPRDRSPPRPVPSGRSGPVRSGPDRGLADQPYSGAPRASRPPPERRRDSRDRIAGSPPRRRPPSPPRRRDRSPARPASRPDRRPASPPRDRRPAAEPRKRPLSRRPRSRSSSRSASPRKSRRQRTRSSSSSSSSSRSSSSASSSSGSSSRSSRSPTPDEKRKTKPSAAK